MKISGSRLIAIVAMLATLAACSEKATDTSTVKELEAKRFSPSYQLTNDSLVTKYLGIISNYSQVKEALVQGNSALTKERATKLSAAVASFLIAAPKDTSTQSQVLRKHCNELRLTATAIQQSGLLFEQRQHFYAMSQYMMKFIKDFGTAGLFLRQYTNPAALNGRPAYWFESDSLPEDPYGTPSGAQASLTGVYSSD